VIRSVFGYTEIVLTVRIFCAENYDGDRCGNFNDCLANQITCSNQGTCIDGEDSFTCHCNAGFNGPDCENIDECVTMNISCGNGRCVDGDNTHSCVCEPGFTGEQCDIRESTGSEVETYIIIGGVVGGLVLLILIVLVVIIILALFLRKQKRKSSLKVQESSNGKPYFSDMTDNPVYSNGVGVAPSPQPGGVSTFGSRSGERKVDNPVYGGQGDVGVGFAQPKTGNGPTLVLSPEERNFDNPIYNGLGTGGEVKYEEIANVVAHYDTADLAVYPSTDSSQDLNPVYSTVDDAIRENDVKHSAV
jgi:hypothetical protein